MQNRLRKKLTGFQTNESHIGKMWVTSSQKVEKQEDTELPSETEIQNNEEDVIYNIGDAVTLKDWEITISDMQIVESIEADYVSFSPKEEGGRYAQVFVKATNNGKEAARFMPSVGFGDDVSTKLLFGDGYEFSSTYLLGYSNDIHDSTINPLSSNEGEIAFEIPESVVNSSDQILIQFKSNKDTVEIKVR